MTATEKAIALVDKYREYVKDLVPKEYELAYSHNEETENAKACAIIACDSQVELLNQFTDYWDLKNGEWYRDEMLKINEVKEQIELLK